MHHACLVPPLLLPLDETVSCRAEGERPLLLGVGLPPIGQSSGMGGVSQIRGTLTPTWVAGNPKTTTCDQ